MLKVYLPEPAPKVPLLPFLPGGSQYHSRLFQSLPEGAFEGLVESVPLDEAKYVLLPHDYGIVDKEYTEQCLAEAKRAGKRTIVVSFQDNPAPITLPDTIVFRPSAYKSQLLAHEIVMPGLVEDIGATHGSAPQSKGEQVTVGFVGKAGFATFKERIRYLIRNYVLARGPRREGMYFRRRALASLSNHPSVTLMTKVRRQFSANRKTAELPPEQLRSEYISSLVDSLLTLAPRGDGNYSLRFYETLSVGRIPILIDTDIQLPLEGTVPYDACMLRIPWQEVDRTGDKVAAFFATHTDEELMQMQRKARAVFEEYLYLPAFLRRALTEEFLDAVPS